MLRNPKFAVILVSMFLALYCAMFLAGYSNIVAFMFILSPFLVIWMVFTVLKYGKFTGRELKENEEWGYGDKAREEF